MKYLKTFEKLQEQPEVGDYVLINTVSTIKGVSEYINNTFGQIIDIQPDKIDIWDFKSVGDIVVKYTDVPSEIKSWFNKNKNITRNYAREFDRRFSPEQVVAFAKTKEELELKLTANKYNL